VTHTTYGQVSIKNFMASSKVTLTLRRFVSLVIPSEGLWALERSALGRPGGLDFFLAGWLEGWTRSNSSQNFGVEGLTLGGERRGRTIIFSSASWCSTFRSLLGKLCVFYLELHSINSTFLI